VPGGPRDRQRLEHVCRYVARPAIATERLSELPDGRIAYDLRRPWSDGTTAIPFEPRAFLEKLAALVRPPRAHLVTYHGVLAPASALRAALVPQAPGRRDGCAADAGTDAGADAGGHAGTRRHTGRHPCAELMKRVFAVDVLACPSCARPPQDHRGDHAGGGHSRHARRAQPAGGSAGDGVCACP